LPWPKSTRPSSSCACGKSDWLGRSLANTHGPEPLADAPLGTTIGLGHA
jgi:hypothetical protein